MNWELLWFASVISFLGMISPGPDFFLVMKNSLSYPRRLAMMTCSGVIVAILTHMIYCVAGIAILIKTTPWLFILLRYAGAIYLVFIGIKSLLAKGSVVGYIGSDTKKNGISYKKAFAQGYFCNLLNPKATLFFLAIFTQVVSVDSTFTDKLAVAFIILIEAIIWWSLVVMVFQSPLIQRRYFKVQFIIDKLLGVILIALGVKVALGI